MPIIEAVSQAPAGDYPPYPVWAGSEYQGWLWTMDNERFNRADVRHLCPHYAIQSSGMAISCAIKVPMPHQDREGP